MAGLSGEHLGLLRFLTGWGDFDKGGADEIEHNEKHDNNGWFLDDLESVLQAGHNDCQLINMNVSPRSKQSMLVSTKDSPMESTSNENSQSILTQVSMIICSDEGGLVVVFVYSKTKEQMWIPSPPASALASWSSTA